MMLKVFLFLILSFALNAKDKIIIATSYDSYPFHFSNQQGKADGLNVDIWKLWSEKTGIDVEFKVTSWANTINMVRTGEAHIHAGLFKNVPRQKFLNYERPLKKAQTHIFTHTSIRPLSKVNELKGFEIGLVDGDYSETFVKENMISPNIKKYLNHENLIEAAIKGDIKVFIADTATAVYLLKRKKKYANFKHNLSSPLYENAFHAAASKKYPDLLQKITDGLNLIDKDEMVRINRKWTDYTGRDKDDVIIITASHLYHPFSAINEYGQPVGLLIDFWNYWAKKQNVNIEFKLTPWSKTVQNIKKGVYDIHSGIFRNEEREKYLDFSLPFFKIKSAWYYRNASNSNFTKKTMANRTVGVIEGTYQHTWLEKNYPKINIYAKDNYKELLNAIMENEIVGLIGEVQIANEFIAQLDLENQISQGQVLLENSLHAAVKKGDIDTIALINDGLKKMNSNALSQIEDNWLPNKNDKLFRPISAEAESTIIGNKNNAFLIVLIILTISLILVSLSVMSIKSITSVDPSKLYGSKRIRLFALLTVCIILGAVSSIAIISINDIKDKILNQTRSEMLAIMKTTQESLNIWIKNEKNFFIQTLRNKNVIENPIKKSHLLHKELMKLQSKYHAIIDKNNIVIHSNIPSSKNKSLGDIIPTITADIIENKGQAYLLGPYRIASLNTPYLFLQTVITSQNGDKYIVLASVDPFKEFTRITQLGRLGETGETYLFNIDGQMISRSRFDSELKDLKLIPKDSSSILNLSIKAPPYRLDRNNIEELDFEELPYTKMITSATKGNSSSDMNGYRDYRGQLVLGVWNWDHTHHFGIATEIDYEEALSTYYEQRNIVFLTLIITLILCLTLSVISLWIGKSANKSLELAKINLEQDVVDRTIQLHKEKTLSENLIRSAPDALIIINDQGLVYRVNEQTIQMFGYQREELIGKPIEIFIPDELRENHINLRNRYIQNPTVRAMGLGLTLLGQRKDGTQFPVELSLSPIETEAGLLIAGSARDISERKSLEKDLRIALERAESATQAKSDFLANMSHEIRTPINAVIGLNYLLQKTDIDNKQRDYSTKIERAAKNLLGIINDILDFSKIEAGKLKIESIDFELNDVLDNLSNVIGVKALEKGLEFVILRRPNVPQMLIGDPLRLGQVLINLVSNAVKFTEKGEIIVELEMNRETKDEVWIDFVVRDTGIGLSEKQQSVLFEAFSQADTSITRRFGGTGLGLTISNNLVGMMDGQIEVRSKLNKGSDFYFTAKFLKSEAIPKKKKVIPEVLNDMKVLIVDDSTNTQLVFTDYLSDFTDHTHSESSGEEAINYLKTTLLNEKAMFDLILLDWQMPGMDGIQTAKKIKQIIPENKSPKIIMVTAHGREEIMDQADKIGLDGFLIKPVSQSDLFDCIVTTFIHEEDNHIVSEDSIEVQLRDQLDGLTILLVEDNEINQQVAQEILEQFKIDVIIANNGQEACDKIGSKEFDVVLMDLQMPVMSGFEASKEIRKKAEYDHLPIIAMTADAMTGVREEALSCGMNDYLTKPIDPTQMLTAIAKWTNDGSQHDLSVNDLLKDSHRNDAEESEISISQNESKLLNFEDGKRRVANNEKLYHKLLNKMIDDYNDFESKINKMLAEKKLKDATRLAHSLKGVASNLGAEQLHELTLKLESLLKENKYEDSTEFIHKITKNLKNIEKSLEDENIRAS